MTRKHPYTLHSTTPAALAKMRSHESPYETDVMGLPILVLPGVWSPAYDWSGRFHVENLPDVTGRACLEIGCGTGVISVFTARAGAAHMVAVDINTQAVENTRINFGRFGILNGETFLSEDFTNVHGTFDVIMWNAPYHGSRPTDILEHGCTDENYHNVRTFFQKAPRYVRPAGTVVFGFSDAGDVPLIEGWIAENGFHIQRKLSDWREGYNCILFFLTR